MEVELIAYTQACKKDKDNDLESTNPLSIVEKCACVCYDSKPTEDCRIAKNCMESMHGSVFEHVSFTFHISGVSRALLAELSRHRHISLSVRSTRYCNESNFEWEPIYTNTVGNDEEISAHLHETQEIYNRYIKENLADKDELRGILPLSLYTEMYMTANARALIEMSHLRMCERSHKEMRKLFENLKKQVALVAPEISDYMRPKCEIDKEHPFCTEKKGCGKHKRLDEIYRSNNYNLRECCTHCIHKGVCKTFEKRNKNFSFDPDFTICDSYYPLKDDYKKLKKESEI